MILGSLQVETFTGQRFEVAFTVGPHCSRVNGVFNPAPERFSVFLLYGYEIVRCRGR